VADLDYCPVCHRPRFHTPVTLLVAPDMEGHDLCKLEIRGGRVYYVHDYFGCESGCCGHKVVVEDAKGSVRASEFMFEHDKDRLDEAVRGISQQFGIPVARCEFSDD
jgi:hypothetical protein